jgi:hypothetical protein
LEIENFSLIINGIIPREAARNPLFAARAQMQEHYLVQIEFDFPYSSNGWLYLQINQGVSKLRRYKNILRW